MKTSQILIFSLVMVTGIVIGGHLAGHIFFGLITLLGLVMLTENIPFVKWIVYKSNNVLDIAIFIAGIMAALTLGVTITAALTVAGLGYTMVYAPYVRQQKDKQDAKKKEFKFKL